MKSRVARLIFVASLLGGPLALALRADHQEVHRRADEQHRYEQTERIALLGVGGNDRQDMHVRDPTVHEEGDAPDNQR